MTSCTKEQSSRSKERLYPILIFAVSRTREVVGEIVVLKKISPYFHQKLWVHDCWLKLILDIWQEHAVDQSRTFANEKTVILTVARDELNYWLNFIRQTENWLKNWNIELRSNLRQTFHWNNLTNFWIFLSRIPKLNKLWIWTCYQNPT